MKFEKKELVEIVGALAVVISLLFVGMQLLLDRRVAQAEQYSFRSESVKNDIRSRRESDTYMASMAASWDRGDRPDWWTEDMEKTTIENGLSGYDISHEILDYELLYHQTDNLYSQYRAGLLEEEFWQNLRSGNIKRMLISDPIAKGVFIKPSPVRRIDNVLQEILLEIENEL